jgi:hypothetical protein
MSSKRTRLIALFLLAAFAGVMVLQTCDSGIPKTGGDTPDPPEKHAEPKVNVPPFNADSAMVFLTTQVNFGPRVPNTKAHERTGDWIKARMKQYGAEVIEQRTTVNAWDGTPLRMRNIIAEFNPNARKRVLLAAHWDTRPYGDKDPDPAKQKRPIDGANDGASGVAVLLELARLLQANPPSIGVDIIFFDAEDYGRPEWDSGDSPEDYLFWCLGSQYWQKNPHRPGYQAMFGILLDMVGGKNARVNREGVSMQVAPDVVNRVWSTAAQLGYAELFQEPVTGEITDDHIFMNMAGVRSIDIIDMRPATKAMGFGGYEFGNTHHTHSDNLENIDPATLEAVGRTLMHVVYHTK